MHEPDSQLRFREATGVTAGRLLGFVVVALLAASCGSDRVAVDELPVAQGYFGGCNARMLAAIAHRDLDSVRKLRARQAVGNCDETQEALYHAITDHDTERLELLLAAGVDPEAPGSDHRCPSPLGYAFRNRHDDGANAAIVTDTAMLKLLIDAGADIEAEWRSAGCYHPSWRGGGRPLVVAVVAGDVEVVRLLIEAGADVGHRNAGGLAALNFVPLSVRPENRLVIADLLREAMAKQGTP